jgi:hypothetical protein
MLSKSSGVLRHAIIYIYIYDCQISRTEKTLDLQPKIVRIFQRFSLYIDVLIGLEVSEYIAELGISL